MRSLSFVVRCLLSVVVCCMLLFVLRAVFGGVCLLRDVRYVTCSACCGLSCSWSLVVCLLLGARCLVFGVLVIAVCCLLCGVSCGV